METGELIIAENSADLPDQAAARIAREVRRAVEARGHASLALAGGSTPRPVYERLCLLSQAEGLPWERIDFYFGDERCVPPDHPESNFRMARETLLRGRDQARGRVHRMRAELADRDEAAREYEELLPDRLDVLLLGMGSDGHTASLFPGSAALREHERRVVAVQGSKPPAWRLTITPPVIESARALIVIAAGQNKAAVLARVFEGPFVPEELPAQLARRGVWIVDRLAASKLGGGS